MTRLSNAVEPLQIVVAEFEVAVVEIALFVRVRDVILTILVAASTI